MMINDLKLNIYFSPVSQKQKYIYQHFPTFFIALHLTLCNLRNRTQDPFVFGINRCTNTPSKGESSKVAVDEICFISLRRNFFLMKYLVGLILIVNTTFSFNQKILKDIHLKRSLKQEGEQYQFTVLDKDEKGVRSYKKDRFYYWYKAQHVIATQGASSGDLLHGGFEAYHDNKQLSKKGAFSKGLKSGEWLYWREDGTLITAEHWKKGRLKGTETNYDKEGNAFQTTRHKRFSYKRENADSIVIGKKASGSETILMKDSLGEITRIEKKKNGALHGTAKELENGKVVSKTTYKNGQPVIKKKAEKQVTEEEKTTDAEKRRQWNIPGKKRTEEGEKSDQRKQKVKQEEARKEKKEKPGKTAEKATNKIDSQKKK